MLEAVFDAIETNRQANRGLPGSAYTSDSFFDWECRNVFEQGWFALAFGADAPSPGDLFPVEVLGMSFIVARGEDMELRVFHNVCRHRGRRLVDGPAHGARLIRCPYHAWTYRLDGRLQGTPHIGGPGVHDVCGFAREDHSLFEVPSATWLDIVFVNPGGGAGAFADHVAPLAARLDSLWGAGGGSQLASAADCAIVMTVESNWKLALENYLEAYHLPFVHPGLNRYSPLAEHYIFADAAGFAGQGVTRYRPTLAARALPSLPSWPIERRETAEYPALYPNALLGIQHDHLFAMLLIPQGPQRTLERVAIQFVGHAATDEASAETRRAVCAGWREVFEEDVAAVEGMQAGRRCGAFDGGVFTPVLDVATAHFHRWYAAQVAGLDAGS